MDGKRAIISLKVGTYLPSNRTHLQITLFTVKNYQKGLLVTKDSKNKEYKNTHFVSNSL